MEINTIPEVQFKWCIYEFERGPILPPLQHSNKCRHTTTKNLGCSYTNVLHRWWNTWHLSDLSKTFSVTFQNWQFNTRRRESKPGFNFFHSLHHNFWHFLNVQPIKTQWMSSRKDCPKVCAVNPTFQRETTVSRPSLWWLAFKPALKCGCSEQPCNTFAFQCGGATHPGNSLLHFYALFFIPFIATFRFRNNNQHSVTINML